MMPLANTARWTVLALFLAGCLDNSAPEMLPIPAQTAHVGSRFELRIEAHDSDGDKLDFGFSSPTLSLDGRARLYELGSEAVFAWTPLAADVGEHQIDFTASDGDAQDRESVKFTVKPSTSAENAPVFRKPLGEGTTLDKQVTDCLRLDVMVEDPDSVQVDITQNPAIPGSELQATGPLEARFSWCPTDAQVAQAVFMLRLAADDHDNPVVKKNFTILIRSDLPRNCPGEAPVIQHTPPPGRETTEAIKITAVVTDDKGLKANPMVYYSTNKPPDPTKLDFNALSQLEMSPVSTTQGGYEASIPNPTSTLNPGESATVFYVLVAEDDDDSGAGNCDHRTQLPANDLFQVKVTKPQQSTTCTTSDECQTGELCDNKTCVKDTCTPKDVNGDKLYHEQSTCPTKHFCPEAGPSTGPSHCAATCTTDSDCKVTGHKCKVFDTKKGCALAGKKVIGRECKDFTECDGKAMCLPWSGGYCSISDCSSFGSFSGKCPTGAACIPLTDSRFSLKTHWLCLQLCKDDSNCRTGDGYSCKSMKDDQSNSKLVCAK
jgi:hypothetical protein